MLFGYMSWKEYQAGTRADTTPVASARGGKCARERNEPTEYSVGSFVLCLKARSQLACNVLATTSFPSYSRSPNLFDQPVLYFFVSPMPSLIHTKGIMLISRLFALDGVHWR